jgi:hypothetical protein
MTVEVHMIIDSNKYDCIDRRNITNNYFMTVEVQMIIDSVKYDCMIVEIHGILSATTPGLNSGTGGSP